MNAEENIPGTVLVKILDKEYQVSCPPSEQEALLKSARYLDENMRKIKARGNIHGMEKISVMAALNITHDMLSKSHQLNESRHQTLQKLKFLEEKIDRSLQINRQIEIS
ncbi:MAG: cell division protein ZapA [Pseudomonadales bacterium]|nr:cell division protein ZapA [Pseudomonadales bacterium]MCP5330298.1 cell division protein ZapA [Pseudomonadales bacterium]MCP5344087.1 cell division protein ZapA [Pseudomonadales bacterium]